MRKVVLGLDEDGIVELATSQAAVRGAGRASSRRPEWTFQYSPEMFSGTELRLRQAGRSMPSPRSGGRRPQRKCIINLPSTVEHSTPNIFADMIEWMHRNLARRDAIVLSVHPHNDRGTGVAAGELALMAGADRVEGCLFGNGERTGNVDLVNARAEPVHAGRRPGLDFSDIDEIRRTVEHCNQLPVHPRHPYVGDLVLHLVLGLAPGRDQEGVSAAPQATATIWDMPYLPIDPKDLGRSYEAVIRVNSQSGKGGIAYLLEREYGLRTAAPAADRVQPGRAGGDGRDAARSSPRTTCGRCSSASTGRAEHTGAAAPGAGSGAGHGAASSSG